LGDTGIRTSKDAGENKLIQVVDYFGVADVTLQSEK